VRLLLVTALPAEADAVGAALPDPSPTRIGPYAATTGTTGVGEVAVLAGGVGPAAAAAATAAVLALAARWDAVLSVGVAGGFPGRAAVADVVVATATLAADLGADSPDGFLALGELGFPGDRFAAPLAAGLTARLRAASVGPVTGPILTVSTVTGTAARAGRLATRHDAVAEAMEGAGVATAAGAFGVPFGEVRTVSNLVGDRERARWEIPRALAALSVAARALLAEPWCLD
jgi:futalosine hydrolase